jgi:hypothetical protein
MADVISSVSVLIAALSFVAGVSAWKREFVGKRRIELAESVLAMFYEAEDAIREIRNPFSFGGEGKTRKRAENEREEESQLLDQAYVVFERYQKREQFFAQLRSMRYRYMAAFGSSAAEPFDELAKVLNEIFIAARMLGTHYWPRQGRVEMKAKEFQKHLDDMHRHEAVFWYMGDDQDAITPRVRNAVKKVEAITSGAVASQTGLLDDLKNWVTRHAKDS